MIRFGPKLAGPPEGLDDDSQERLDHFLWLAGQGDLIATRRLVWLAVMRSDPRELEDGGRFKDAHQRIVLTPHTMVMTKQEAIGAPKVNYYVARYRDGEDVKPLRVAESAPHVWWHLDGLHRLLAARILGLDVEARVYR